MDLVARGGDSRNVLHRLDQRVRARTADSRASRSSSTADRAASARRRFSWRARAARACSRPPDRPRSAPPASGSAPSARSTTARPTSSRRCATLTGGRGVDVVLDMVGGDYFARNIDVLAVEGRLVQIATLHGAKAELEHPDDHAAAADDHRLDAAGAVGRGERRDRRRAPRSTSGRCSNRARSSRSSTRRSRCATPPRRTA